MMQLEETPSIATSDRAQTADRVLWVAMRQARDLIRDDKHDAAEAVIHKAAKSAARILGGAK